MIVDFVKPECFSSRTNESLCGTFFVTLRTYMGAPLFAVPSDANRVIKVLRLLVSHGCFEMNDFVVMPNHLHMLITVRQNITIERAVQMVKRNFTNRLRREIGYQGEVWQPGYSEKRASTGEDYQRFRSYIARNPVAAGLCRCANDFPYSFAYRVQTARARGVAETASVAPTLDLHLVEHN